MWPFKKDDDKPQCHKGIHAQDYRLDRTKELVKQVGIFCSESIIVTNYICRHCGVRFVETKYLDKDSVELFLKEKKNERSK